MHLKSLSFIMENGYKFLEILYKFLFVKYYFANAKDAVTFELPEDAELYYKIPLVTFSNEIKEGRSIIETSDLNNMHFGKLIDEISKLKEIAKKAEEVDGEHNQTNK